MDLSGVNRRSRMRTGWSGETKPEVREGGVSVCKGGGLVEVRGGGCGGRGEGGVWRVIVVIALLIGRL